ncbi:MAG TPA: hypothetical protein VI911_10805 [Patescibacteria group bacterium]|nr:hypothetical protein [Patescibacteria group bacterium]
MLKQIEYIGKIDKTNIKGKFTADEKFCSDVNKTAFEFVEKNYGKKPNEISSSIIAEK